MKNVYEVLRQKELEVTRLRDEVEALRIAAPLLEGEEVGDGNKPRLATSTAVNAPPQADRAAGWDDRAKRWP